jgi:hypothetical protein
MMWKASKSGKVAGLLYERDFWEMTCKDIKVMSAGLCESKPQTERKGASRAGDLPVQRR